MKSHLLGALQVRLWNPETRRCVGVELVVQELLELLFVRKNGGTSLLVAVGVCFGVFM